MKSMVSHSFRSPIASQATGTGGSAMKVNSSGVQSTGSRRKPRPAWNEYLTDGNQYKLDKEKLLQRKQQMISKNNILIEENEIKVVRTRIPLRSKSVNRATDEAKQGRGRWALDSPSTKRVPTQLSKRSASAAAKRRHVKHESEKEDVNSLDLIIRNERSDSLNEKENYRSKHLINDMESDSIRKVTSRKAVPAHRMQLNNQPTKFHNKQSAKKSSSHSASAMALDISDDDSSIGRIREVYSPKESSARKVVPSTKQKSNQYAARNNNERVPLANDAELEDITTEIKSLHAELKYFEELSGKRSVLDAEELEDILGGDSMNNPVTQKSVMRYLVQLVCQSMSHLLKSELELQSERSKYDSLHARIETLTGLVLTTSATSRALVTSEDVQTPYQHQDKIIDYYSNNIRSDLYPTPRLERSATSTIEGVNLSKDMNEATKQLNYRSQDSQILETPNTSSLNIVAAKAASTPLTWKQVVGPKNASSILETVSASAGSEVEAHEDLYESFRKLQPLRTEDLSQSGIKVDEFSTPAKGGIIADPDLTRLDALIELTRNIGTPGGVSIEASRDINNHSQISVDSKAPTPVRLIKPTAVRNTPIVRPPMIPSPSKQTRMHLPLKHVSSNNVASSNQLVLQEWNSGPKNGSSSMRSVLLDSGDSLPPPPPPVANVTPTTVHISPRKGTSRRSGTPVQEIQLANSEIDKPSNTPGVAFSLGTAGMTGTAATDWIFGFGGQVGTEPSLKFGGNQSSGEYVTAVRSPPTENLYEPQALQSNAVNEISAQKSSDDNKLLDSYDGMIERLTFHYNERSENLGKAPPSPYLHKPRQRTSKSEPSTPSLYSIEQKRLAEQREKENNTSFKRKPPVPARKDMNTPSHDDVNNDHFPLEGTTLPKNPPTQEQISVIIPQPRAPTPHVAPSHPLKVNVGHGGHASALLRKFQQQKEMKLEKDHEMIYNHPVEGVDQKGLELFKFSYDARSGSYP